MFDILGIDNTILKFFVAFAVVLTLIGLTAWLVRRFGANRLGGAAARGRQPRLAVIDAATVDGRRRLVLIRRDNIEHLLMIGGPTDLVVEPNIVRAVGARDVPREPARIESTARIEPTTGRQSAAADNSWPLQPATDPTPVPAPRPYRSAATEEPWLPPEPGARARPAPDSLTGLAAELSTRLHAPDLAMPRASAAPAAEPATSAQNDHNLAEMAQQLEAALRRAPAPESRPPVTDPLAAPAAKPRDQRSRLEPKFDSKPEPKLDSKFDPKFDPKFEPKFDGKPEPAAAPGKQLFDNLEEEMASLLGRPSGRS